MKSFISDLLSVGFSKVLIIVFGLATSIITARYIGPEGNGLIATLLVYPSLFISIGSLGIRQSTTYFLGKEIYTEDHIKRAISQIWMISTVFSVVVSFTLMKFLSKSGENTLLVILALLPIPFSLFNTYNSGIFLGKNDIKTFNKINWIPSLIGLIGVLLFVILLSLDVVGAMIAMIGGPVFISIILLFKNKFLKSFSFNFDWSIIKSMLSLGTIYAVSLLIINLNYKVDVILLDKLSNSFETGIYTKGSGIVQYLWQIPMMVSTIVFARSAVSKNGRLFSIKVAQLLRVSFVIILLISILLFFCSEILIIGMFGEAFRESISVLNYMLPGVLLITIFKVMNVDLAGKGKPWISMKAMVPALIVNIVLNIIWIPTYGSDGAAIASTVSYSIAGLLFLYFYSKETGMTVFEIIRYKKTDFDPIFNIIKKFKN